MNKMEIQSSEKEKKKETRRISPQNFFLFIGAFLFLIFLFNGGAKAVSSSASSLRSSEKTYSVVIDCGSTGSRIHVYQFSKGSGDSLPKVESEEFVQLKPGLSSYARNPQKGAQSIVPLLEVANNAIPQEKRSVTPIFVGATAGLRMLPGTQADDLLKAVRKLLTTSYEYTLNPETDVQIMSGDDEGKYAWIATNMLLGTLSSSDPTVGVIDLGGGSAQMIRALTFDEAQKLPYGKIQTLKFGVKEIYLYVHSFLNYGLMAARKQILSQQGASKACMPEGFQGPKAQYEYGGVKLSASGGANGNFQGCLSKTVMTLNLDSECEVDACTFAGQFAGEGTSKSKFYMLSYLYERIEQSQAGEFDQWGGVSSVQKVKDAARRVCKMPLSKLEKIEKADEKDRPYLCMDLSYIYSLLNVGLGVTGDIHLAKKFPGSDGAEFEAAWPLGAAVAKLG